MVLHLKCYCWFRKGIPTVVGVENATKEIKDDMLVTVDAANGKVFEGYANVL